MIIGLSMSLCIASICRGTVKLDDVAKIIAGTAAETEAEWELLIKHYREVYWHAFPDEAEAILHWLVAAGKIEQPGNIKRWHVPSTADGIWVNDESEIKWYDAEEAAA